MTRYDFRARTLAAPPTKRKERCLISLGVYSKTEGWANATGCCASGHS